MRSVMILQYTASAKPAAEPPALGCPSPDNRKRDDDLRRIRKYEPHYNHISPLCQQICEIFSNLKGPERVPFYVRNKLFFPAFFA